jgi:hypothetical protein
VQKLVFTHFHPITQLTHPPIPAKAGAYLPAMTAPDNAPSPLPTDSAASAFKAKWSAGGTAYDLNERQGAQTYFLDLCELLGVPAHGTLEGYVFEKQTLALGQQRGFADVFYKNRFAWETKAPGKKPRRCAKATAQLQPGT